MNKILRTKKKEKNAENVGKKKRRGEKRKADTQEVVFALHCTHRNETREEHSY